MVSRYRGKKNNLEKKAPTLAGSKFLFPSNLRETGDVGRITPSRSSRSQHFCTSMTVLPQL